MGKVWAGPATGKAGQAAARLLPGQVKCGSHGKAAGPVDGTGKRYQEAPGQGRDRWSRVNSKKEKKKLTETKAPDAAPLSHDTSK